MNFKIAIGLPNTGTIKARTVFSLLETVRQSKDIDFLPIFRYGNHIFENRERIVEIAEEQKCTHLFFVDSDMRFPPETLKQLLLHNKDIIGTMYNYRFLPLTNTVKFFKEKSENLKDIFEVAALGMGCLLIKMSIFETMKKPYFPIGFGELGKVTMTEDVGFCEKARESGFKVWCDPTIRVKHLGDYEY